jgi:hypothetical protein
MPKGPQGRLWPTLVIAGILEWEVAEFVYTRHLSVAEYVLSAICASLLTVWLWRRFA